MRLYIATTNPGKLRDFAGIASSTDPGGQMEIVCLPGMAETPPPVEDGATFEANARKKAEYYSRLLPGELVLADDSGLEVDALGAAPGVQSARYAAVGGEGEGNASDSANNAKLLRELDGVPGGRRTARFVCALAAARDGITLHTSRGEVKGVILRETRGEHGFGYDPLFYVPELGKTTAELTPEEKGRVSHRGRAFAQLLKSLVELQRTTKDVKGKQH